MPAKTATKTAKAAPSVVDTGFRAEEPEVLTTRRPASAVGGRTAEEWRGQEWPRRMDRFRALPKTGPGVVTISVIGARAIVKPVDQAASIRLDGLRAQAGIGWDAKRKADVAKFDEVTRRGVSGFESLELLLAMGGVPTAIDENTATDIDRYRTHLTRQKLPIPRMIWVDEAEKPLSEITGEISIVGSRHSGRGRKT